MSWSTNAREALQRGETVVIRPRGHSMTGRVNDGDRVTLCPLAGRQLEKGDVVLVRVKGRVYLHLIKAINGTRYLIGNNRGGTNGWVGLPAIYGIAVQVAPSK